MTTSDFGAWNSPSYRPPQGGTSQPAAQSQSSQPNNRKASVKPYQAASQQNFGFDSLFNFSPYPAYGASSYSPTYNQPPMNGFGGGYPASGPSMGGYGDPARYKVDTTLIEVGYYNNGKADEHAQSVREIYQRNNPLGKSNVHYTGIGNDESADTGASQPTRLASKKELDDYIDTESTDAFDIMADKINGIVEKGNTEVINGSLGYSRDTIYENVLLSLKDNPKLAPVVGLKPTALSSLEKNKDGQVLVTDEVSNAIVAYVDGRLDQRGSAYQKSRLKYQQATQYAAQNGVTVVVAAGNDHEMNEVFNARKKGGDTNFLAQSDYVISVAAANDQGTPQPNDDEIASFSSWGDGRYNPTVSANGVGVKTRFGPQDGTSFAAPEVAATVARMKQVNPYLSFDQIKAILQQSATDLYPNSSIADGAGVINPDLAVQWSQQLSQSA